MVIIIFHFHSHNMINISLQIKEEAVAIFKIPMVSDLGFEKFIPELTTNQVELVTLKKHTKMKDILTSNYDYKIIKNKKYKL